MALSIATLPLDSGGWIGICRLPGLLGELDADIATIVEWRPAVVGSMTEAAEMLRSGCDDLGALLGRAAIDWAHLPIRDFGGPEGGSRDAWPGLAARLHKILDEGGALLLHCRGGQGRLGMIALRLLVERGEEADAALRRLRVARPGAVETDAQLKWALDGQRCSTTVEGSSHGKN